MKEYLDVYDVNGNKTGERVERGRHQKEGAWYLCIHAYVVTRDGSFIIQRRSMTKQYFPGIWDITCGAATSGEDSLTAALREVKEELGLDLRGCQHTLVGRGRCYDCLNDVYIFKTDFTLDDCTPDPEEVMDVKTVDTDGMLKLIYESNFKDGGYYEMMEKALRRLSEGEN